MIIAVYDSISKKGIADAVVTIKTFNRDAIIQTTGDDGKADMGKVVLTENKGTLWITFTAHKNIRLNLTGISDITWYAVAEIETPPPDPPTFPDEPGEPIPNAKGETVVSTVGTQCDILEKWMFERRWYKHKNRYTGLGTHWDSEKSDAIDMANDDETCFLPKPPTPAEWQKGIESTLKTGFGIITSYVTDSFKNLSDRITGFTVSIGALIAITSALLSRIEKTEGVLTGLNKWFIEQFEKMKDTVIGWIEKAFIDIIEKVLNGDKKT